MVLLCFLLSQTKSVQLTKALLTFPFEIQPSLANCDLRWRDVLITEPGSRAEVSHESRKWRETLGEFRDRDKSSD